MTKFTLNEQSEIWNPKKNWKILFHKPYFKKEWIDDLPNYLQSSLISNYNVAKIFEKQLAEYCKCRYTVTTNSGTSAILTGMIALGLKKGDMVIGPNYGQIAWANCCKFLGLNPYTIDVRKDTFCIDENILIQYLEKYREKVKAVVFLNQGGYTGSNLEEVSKICKKYNVFLLEDSCNALGQWYNGKHAGTFGDIGFISFGSPKIITCGEGGAILINDEKIYEKCRDFIYQGGWYDPPMHSRHTIGLNFVMPSQNAYLLSKQLADINELLLMRDKICNTYESFGLKIKRFHQSPTVYEYYTKNPDKLIKIGKLLKIQFFFRFYVTIGHLFSDEIIDTPVCKDLENHLITLPNSFDLTEKELNLIGAAIKMSEK